MQGFVNFAADIGTAIAVLIPLICYLFGGGLLIASIWGFWQVLNPGSATHRHPWRPFAALTISTALLSFDRIVNFATASFGGGVNSALTTDLTSYTPPAVNGSLMGATPEDTLLNIITAFEYFFEAYGALVVLFGLLSLHHVMKGTHQHGIGKPLVQIVFGIAVMNVSSIATTVMGYFA